MPAVKRVTTKQELIRALGSPDLLFVGEFEPVTDADLRLFAEQVKAMQRKGKRIHLAVIERRPPPPPRS